MRFSLSPPKYHAVFYAIGSGANMLPQVVRIPHLPFDDSKPLSFRIASLIDEAENYFFMTVPFYVPGNGKNPCPFSYCLLPLHSIDFPRIKICPLFLRDINT